MSGTDQMLSVDGYYLNKYIKQMIGSVQFSCSVMLDYLQPHRRQDTRTPCPSATPAVYSSSYPSSRWCHPIISFSVIPFSSCFSVSQHQGLFQWVSSSSGGQSIEASASASVLLKNIQDWFLLGLTGLISLWSRGLSRVFNTTVQKHQFFSAQLYSLSNSHIHTKTERSSVWQMFPFVFYSSEIILVSMTRYLFPKTLCRNTLKLSIPWLLLCGLPTLCQWNFLNEVDLNLGRWCRISSLSY